MAHAAARRRRAARDEADHRLVTALGALFLDEGSGFFFRAAADLADHDDRLGVVVVEEEIEHVDEVRAVDRVAADADRRGLAQADHRGLMHGFIGQRTRARDHADAALLEDRAGHDADLAFAGREDAGAVRADEARLGTRQRRFHLDHVEHRNAFGDRDDQVHLGVDRLEDRVGGEGRRHVDARCGRAGFGLGFLDGVELRQADMVGAALTGRHTRNHLRPVIERLLRVEGAGVSGHPLSNDLGVLVYEDAHRWSFRHPSKCWDLPLLGRALRHEAPACAGATDNLASGYFRLSSKPLQASSSSSTASVETLRLLFSSSDSSISITSSVPPAPIMVGTPT